MTSMAMRKMVLILSFLSILGFSSCTRGGEVAVEQAETPVTEVQVKEEVKMEDIQGLKEKTRNRVLPEGEYGREDPFALIGEEKVSIIKKPEIAKKAQELRLEGVVWDARNPLAIVDGKTVAEGDKIGDKTVEKIEEDSVILFDGRNRIKLRL